MATQPTIGAGADDWLVYADQLQAQGDARGELIVLNHAVASGTPPEARDNYVKAHAESLLGKAGSRVDALRLGWRWLWIDTWRSSRCACRSRGPSASRTIPTATSVRTKIETTKTTTTTTATTTASIGRDRSSRC